MNINKEQIRKSFKKSINTYDEHAIMQREICCRLVELTDAYAKCTYDKVLEVGCGTGMLTKMIIEDFGIDELCLNDIVLEMEDVLTDMLKTKDLGTFNFIMGDAEKLILPKDCDLIISGSAFQWFEDLEAVLVKLHKSLSKKGYLIYSSFAEDNFKEIREIRGGGLDYRSYKLMKELLSKYYTVKHSESQQKRLYFATPLDILKHLRLTGVNATGVHKPWTKTTLKEFEEQYRSKYSDEKGVYLTYNPVYFVCHK